MPGVNEQKPRHRASGAPRVPMPEEKAQERIKDFRSVGKGYSRADAMTEANRCLQCGRPPCQEGCPVNIDIKDFIGAVIDEDFDLAIKTIKKRNWLPAICGRVCPQERQCEGACILGKKGEPVNIGALERYLGDLDVECKPKSSCLPEMADKTGRKCAVIGSGPSGLACAGELARLGHDVTIFEALHAPGGVLAYGIPDFRLPEKVLASEIKSLIAMGVTIELNCAVGRTVTIDSLIKEENFEAVFLGAGAGLPKFLNVPGENLAGVFSANEFLTRITLMKANKFPHTDTPVWRGDRVVVVGGGNVAMDAARTALRLGASKVSVVYRRTKVEMPAREEEVRHAEEEGVEFLMLNSPLEVVGSSGFVTGLRCQVMELGEVDERGRRSPVPVEGEERIVECDTIVIAVGTRANPLAHVALPDVERNDRGYIVVNENGATSQKGVWAGGDIVTGAATVILAMGAGRNAALDIDVYLRSGKAKAAHTPGC